MRQKPNTTIKPPTIALKELITKMNEPPELQSSHKLDFESTVEPRFGHLVYRIGTCRGQWGSTDDSYYILSIFNFTPGNGHLEDVFQWFEYSSMRDKKNLLILEIISERFYRHLLSKRGFLPLDKDGENVIKVFNKEKYNQLKKDGNGLIMPGTLKCI